MLEESKDFTLRKRTPKPDFFSGTPTFLEVSCPKKS